MKFIKRTSTFSRTLRLPLLFLSGSSRRIVCCLAWNGLPPPFFFTENYRFWGTRHRQRLCNDGVGFHRLQLQRRKHSSDQKASQRVVAPRIAAVFRRPFPPGTLLSSLELPTACFSSSRTTRLGEHNVTHTSTTAICGLSTRHQHWLYKDKGVVFAN